MDYRSTFGNVVVLILFLATASKTSDIRLVQEDGNHNLNKGAVTVRVSGNWYSVCRSGWGKHEAWVACKQAGYQGGFIYNIEASSVIPNPAPVLMTFECNGSESALQSCSFEMKQSCPQNRVAGVQCYETFDVHLVGGTTPNMGRVEVRYDGVWANVCYEGGPGNIDWRFYNVQILCKELGFPGAMISNKGGQGIGTRRFNISDFRCMEDLDHSSIADCYPDPYRRVETMNASCGHDNDAVGSCAVPGYIGCYTEDKPSKYLFKWNYMPNMTISFCRKNCRDLKARYATLTRSHTCYCFDRLSTPRARDGDRDCSYKCAGNDFEACGGIDTSYNLYMSVYDVTVGVCKDPNNTAKIYDYGETYEIPKCAAGQGLVGSHVIQCVLGDHPNVTRWNASLPYCKDLPSARDTQGMLIGSVCGFLVALLVILVGMMILWRYKRKHTIHQGSRNDSTAGIHSDSNKPSLDTVAVATVDVISPSLKVQTDTEVPSTGETQQHTTSPSDKSDQTHLNDEKQSKNKPLHEYSYIDSALIAETPRNNNPGTVEEYEYAEVKTKNDVTDTTPRFPNGSDQHALNAANSEKDGEEYSYAYAEVNGEKKHARTDDNARQIVTHAKVNKGHKHAKSAGNISKSDSETVISNQHQVHNDSQRVSDEYSYAYAEVNKSNDKPNHDISSSNPKDSPKVTNDCSYTYAEVDKTMKDQESINKGWEESNQNKPKHSKPTADEGWEENKAYHLSMIGTDDSTRVSDMISYTYAEVNENRKSSDKVNNDVSGSNTKDSPKANNDCSYTYAEVDKTVKTQESTNKGRGKSNEDMHKQSKPTADEGWEENTAYHLSTIGTGGEGTANVETEDGEGWVENDIYNVENSTKE